MIKRRSFFQWCMCAIILFLLNGYNPQSTFAGTKANKSAAIQGNWGEGLKSVSIDIPLTISIDKNVISIQSTSLRSDITIRVSRANEPIYEQTVFASETGNISIDLDYLEKGTYRLDLTNQWGDHLYDDFDIQK